jgi:hypothetical protein
MNKEGFGHVAPARIAIRIKSGESERFKNAANRRDEFRSYQKRADRWGRGFLKSISGLRQSAAPIYAGFLGEHALAEYLGCQLGVELNVDTELKTAGDGGTDLSVFGINMQVKLRQRNSGVNHIRRTSAGRIFELTAPIYVFAEWDKAQTVWLLGWMERGRIQQQQFKPSPISNANWFNIEIPDAQLEPMARLVDALESRRVG